MEDGTRCVVLLITTVVLCTAKPLNPDIEKVSENPVNVSANQDIWITLSRDPDTNGEPDEFYVTDDGDKIRVNILTGNNEEGSKILNPLNVLTDEETDTSELPEFNVDIIPDFIANSTIEISNITESDFIDFLVASVTDESDIPKLGDSVVFFTDSDTDESDTTKIGDSVSFLNNSDYEKSNFTNVGDSVGFPTDWDTKESDNMDIGYPVDILTGSSSKEIYFPETTTNPVDVVTELKYPEYPLKVNKDKLFEESDFSQTGVFQPGVLAESYPEVSEDEIPSTITFNKITGQFSDEPATPITPVVTTQSYTKELDVQTTTANQTDSENSLDFLTDPDVPKAVEATKKLNELINNYEQNMTREINDGFEFLNMTSRFQRTRGLKKRHLVKRVKRDLIPFIGDNEELINIIGTIVEYIEDEDEQHPELLFSIISDVGNGYINALTIYYKQREDGKYNFKKVTFSGRFKLAATLIIARISKSNSTASETKDVISYLPREDATQNDVTDLMDLMVPQLARFLFEFSPDTTSRKHNK